MQIPDSGAVKTRAPGRKNYFFTFFDIALDIFC